MLIQCITLTVNMDLSGLILKGKGRDWETY